MQGKPVYRFVGLFLALVILPLVIGKWILGGWSLGIDIPYAYKADFFSHLLLVKGLTQGDWFPFLGMQFKNLGAPFGLNMGDYPIPEQFQYLVIKIISIFSQNPIRTYNLYFLATFPLSSICFYWVSRKLQNGRAVSVVLGALFCALPYHALQLSHLALAGIYFVPLIWLVLLKLAQIQELKKIPMAQVLGISALLGCWHPYYSFFFLALVSFTVLISAVSQRSIRPAVQGALVVGICCFSLLTCLVPNLIYQRSQGANLEVAKRSAEEAVSYALRYDHFLAPLPDHRIPFLAKLGRAMSSGSGDDVAEPIGGFALIGLLWAVLRFFTGKFAGTVPHLIGQSSVFILLLASPRGLGYLFNKIVTPQFRCYNRISIVLACGGLLALGSLLSKWKFKSIRVQIPALLVLGLIGVLDQVSPGLLMRPNLSEYHSDREFFSQTEKLLANNGMILQLPFVPFPEHGSTAQMDDCGHLRGPLFTDSFKWSYAAMKGRPGSAEIQKVSSLPLDLERVRSSGYSAIYIDRRGFQDRGELLETDLAQKLQVKPLVSQDQNLVMFPLPNQIAGVR